MDNKLSGFSHCSSALQHVWHTLHIPLQKESWNVAQTKPILLKVIYIVNFSINVILLIHSCILAQQASFKAKTRILRGSLGMGQVYSGFYRTLSDKTQCWVRLRQYESLCDITTSHYYKNKHLTQFKTMIHNLIVLQWS